MRMLYRIFRICAAIAIFAVFIFCINFVQKRMNSIKAESRLTDTDIVHNAPPVVAFVTVALGGFRGLAADILWLRSSLLQEKGQYFEMVQLASLITKLQPRFTGATAYLAWNMAYNISVVFSDPRDRWRWVRKGIELIRDEALVYNPSDPILYKELGWIYQHKLGNIMDDANLFYKQQMAMEYMKVFGGARPDWSRFASAPESLDEFLKVHPKDDPLWKELELAGFADFADLEKAFREKGGFPEKLAESLKKSAARTDLEWFLRRKWLREVYKLDAAKMLSLNHTYGELDWRLPEAHAIYWATLGLEKSKLTEREISNDRMITQSLKEAFMGGRFLIIDREDCMRVMTMPNLDLVDAVIRSMRQAYETHKMESFRNAALRNFMVDAIVLLYSFGKYSKAEEILENMRKEFPDVEKFRQDIDIFVEGEWKEDIKDAGVNQARALVGSMIYRAYYFLAYGEYEAAAGHMRLAAKIYSNYRKERGESWGRTGMPGFSELKREMMQACLDTFPPEMAKSLAARMEDIKIKGEEARRLEESETVK